MDEHKPLGGRPKKLRPCPLCGASFGGREFRIHRRICAAQSGNMRGRKPKPTALKIAEGDTRKQGVHKLEQRLAAEPKTTRGLPDAPAHLNERAREAWEFWAEELRDMKLDSRPDAMMLEGACVNYARAVQADLILANDGLILEEFKIVGEGESAEAVVVKRRNHPAVAISNAAWRQLRAFCSEFGLSPVSRTRLAVDRKDEATEDLEAILSRPREPRAGLVN